MSENNYLTHRISIFILQMNNSIRNNYFHSLANYLTEYINKITKFFGVRGINILNNKIKHDNYLY